MNDQAQGLRDMVAEDAKRGRSLIMTMYRDKDAGGLTVVDGVPGTEETIEVYASKLGRKAPSLTDDLITYRRLWLDLKNEALADVLRPSVSSIQTNTDRYNRMERKADEAQRLYDRMEQAETLAFYAHVPPATSETWESVREGLRVKR